MQFRGGVLHRLLHSSGGQPVVVRVAQLSDERVLFGGRADDPSAAEWGIERMRVALGIDQDLAEFHERFRFDPLIGAALRADPGMRVFGYPDPFEALAWTICEQLIESERASVIQRRLARALGRRCPSSGLQDSPSATAIANVAPARLESMDLSAARALALIRAAREVGSGRTDLLDPDHERGWRRLRAIRGIGSWTLQKMALTGQGRLDQLPAGDLAFMKLVGRLRTGDPRARATEEEVAAYFERYSPWAGLAGIYALHAGAMGRAAETFAA
jgi:3-methyladenine DNA glycosylase/8-oxoguanine DNA glycosylase